VVKQRHQKLIPLRYNEKLPDDVMLLSGATLSSVVTYEKVEVQFGRSSGDINNKPPRW
jgi:hypothetical protein